MSDVKRAPSMWTRGALPGALVMLALLILILTSTLNFSVMGQTDSTVTSRLISEKLPQLLSAFGAVLLAHLVVGAGLGLLAFWGWRGLLGHFARFPALLSAFTALLIHLGVWATHIRRYPQAHVELFGFWPALQRAITHSLPEGFFLTLKVIFGLWLLAAAVRGFLEGLKRKKTLTLSVVGAIALLVLGYALYSRSRGPYGGDQTHPNILLLADDSFRADRLDSRATPHLTQLAKTDAFVFSQAYTPIARTFPSWASILTGLWPHEHGIRHMFPAPENRLQRLETLPRLFSQAGYRTAVVADYAGDIFSRLDAGFESVLAPRFDLNSLIGQRALLMEPGILPYLQNPLGQKLFSDQRGLVELPRTAITVDELLQEIDRSDGRPFMIAAFFSTSHFPFAAADPDYRAFTSPDYAGANLYMRFRALEEDPEAIARDMAHVNNLYDGTLLQFDRQMDRLISALKERNLWENTIVAITADHGESLGENGIIGHGDHLRGNEISQVPMLMHVPGMKPQKIDALVRSIDWAPTLLQLAHLEIPKTMSGVDLTPLMRGEEKDLYLTAFAETGLWFTTGGSDFFQSQRLSYPGLLQVVELRDDYNGEICLQPSYEDLVTVAKHRAAWNRDHKVISIPTANGVRYEGWRRLPSGQEVEEEPDLRLKEKLLRWSEGGGRFRLLRDYVLPYKPVAVP